MNNNTFEVCFICHYPTTDYYVVNGGEFHCALCMEDAYYASDEEVDALFAAAEHDWTPEDLEDFYQESFR